MPGQAQARVANRNIVLTGACGGLGQALAALYLDSGCAVALVGQDRATLQALAARAPQRARVYTHDVCDLAAAQAFANDWVAAFGVPDIVLANAGISVGVLAEMADDIAVFRKVVEVNLLGVVTTFQPFIAAMRGRGGGVLAATASCAGLQGLPGNAAYCASKAGVIRAMESLRIELAGTGVAVCTLQPGYIATPLTAPNRFAMPFMISAARAAVLMARAIERRDAVRTIPWQMGWLMRLQSMLPRALVERTLRRAGRRPRAAELAAARNK